MALKVSITVQEGADKDKTLEFTEGEILIGRNKGDFPLADRKVSSRHCSIGVDGLRVYIVDHQSTNGTFIAGRRVHSKETLQNLDEIIIGLSRLSVAIMEPLENASPQVAAQKPRPEAETTKKAENFDTAIQRIDDLIQGEMKNFSAWDDPAIADPDDSGVPRVKVLLTAKKGPEGIPNHICSRVITTIGRKDVDIRLNDIDCSRKHAAIEIVNSTQVFIRDLASENGTYVNARRISYEELKSGDLVQMGRSVFEVSIEAAERTSGK